MLDLATIPSIPSSRHGVRRESTTLLVWHSTAGGMARSSAEWIARPASSAGYHYIIERDGSVIASTPLEMVAWHAGVSAWPVPVAGVPRGSSVNLISVGVSFANRNVGVDADGWEVVTEAQVRAACALAAALAVRYPALSDLRAHVRHRDVSPGRKTDPLPATLPWGAFQAALSRALVAA